MADAETDFDLLIVGGGMVGASLACALGGCADAPRIGLVEAVPFDAASQPSYDGRASALAWGSRRILDGIGVWPRVEAGGAAPIETIRVSDRGHFGATRLAAREAGVPALGYVVRNRVLGDALAQRLAELPAVEVIAPARPLALTIEAERAVVTLQGEGGERKVSSRLLVGADGGRSAVRELAGIEARSRDYGQSAVIAEVRMTRPHRGCAFERFTDTGPLALLPLDERDRCSLVWTTRHDQVETLLALDEADFLARLTRRSGRLLGTALELHGRHAYPLALLLVDEPVRPRLALIGNAAHAVHPVGGQGYNLGLRDAVALAETVIDGLRGGRDPGDLTLLQGYASGRAVDYRRTVRFTDSMVGLFSNNLPPLTAARNAGLFALDLLPPLKRLLMEHAMGLAGRQTRPARGLPL